MADNQARGRPASPSPFSRPLRRWEKAFYARLAEEGVDPKSPRAMYIHVACRMVVGDGPDDDHPPNSFGLGEAGPDFGGYPPDARDHRYRSRTVTALTQMGRWTERGFFEWLIGHWPISGSSDRTGRWWLARSWPWDEVLHALSGTSTDEATAAHLATELEQVGALQLTRDQERIVCLALRDT